MKGKIKAILIILAIIIGIRGFFEFIREEPISTKVETVTVLDCYYHTGLYGSEDIKIKIDTHDCWTHTIHVDKDVYYYCKDNIGKDINLKIKRTRLVHWIWNSEMLRVVGY